jgi:RimJ/RimL family protein N-acetyltransferase
MIETDRLILRQWKESDRDIFAELNADQDNMAFFPKTYNRSESDAFIDKTIELIATNGFGLFAVEVKETSQFIGFVGLASPPYETPFTPCTEIGWRLHKNSWGNGYATEAACAVLDFAFTELKKDEIVSFTSPLNLPSINVMKKIGLKRDESGDFDHPRIEPGHELRRHILYRITAQEYF